MFSLLAPFDVPVIESEPATLEDLQRCHSAEYIEAIQAIEEALVEGRSGEDDILELRSRHGFWGDNPAFVGMFDSAAAYTGATIEAARRVRDGAALAFGIGGGLHHALRSKASGFCIYNDPAIACSILRERFSKVAYVDIDVHHGDGVQWIWYDDPSVLTCSIHEEGRTLWPGTGGVEETGAEFTSLNVPMEAGTTADVWIHAFEKTIMPALEAWKPEAIVLQMGTDTHFLDPLAHLLSNQQAWLRSIVRVQELGVPLVAVGGGGYNLSTVPRMWMSAILTLADVAFEDEIPADLAKVAGAPFVSDHDYPYRSGGGRDHADWVIEHLQKKHIPHLKG